MTARVNCIHCGAALVRVSLANASAELICCNRQCATFEGELDDHEEVASWTRATVDTMRQVIAREESMVESLRRKVMLAERRLDACQN